MPNVRVMRHSLVKATGFLFFFLTGIANAEPMAKITAVQFEIDTTGSTALASEALSALEGARSYFVAGGIIPAAGKPLRILAFHSTKEYAAFRLHSNAFGHFYRGRTQSFIVLTDLAREHREALLHEYTHAVAKEAGLTLPQWLNEGFAELYSTLAISNGEALAGLPVAGRLQNLEAVELQPLRRLFDCGTLAANGTDAALLYAQAWALTHMLAYHPAYASNFNQFLRAATKNMDSAAALPHFFGKSLGEIEADLQSYIATLATARGTHASLSSTPALTAAIQDLNPAETSRLLASILEEQPWTRTARATD